MGVLVGTAGTWGWGSLARALGTAPAGTAGGLTGLVEEWAGVDWGGVWGNHWCNRGRAKGRWVPEAVAVWGCVWRSSELK